MLKLNTHSSCSASLFVPPFSHTTLIHISILGFEDLNNKNNSSHSISTSKPHTHHLLIFIHYQFSNATLLASLKPLSTQPQPHLKSSSLPLISSLARLLQVAMHNKRTQHIHNYSRCHHWREPQEKVYPASSICFPSLTTGGSHWEVRATNYERGKTYAQCRVHLLEPHTQEVMVGLGFSLMEANLCKWGFWVWWRRLRLRLRFGLRVFAEGWLCHHCCDLWCGELIGLSLGVLFLII